MWKILLLMLMSTSLSLHAEEPSVTANYAMANYERLQAELPYYQDAVAHPDKYPWPLIPTTQSMLRQGSKGHAVVLLRQRLKTTHDLTSDNVASALFDRDLAAAVKIFQWRHGLTPDGVVGDDTRSALNVSAEMRMQQIQMNIQRWQELAGMGERFILVNIPEFQLHLIEGNHEVLTMKVVTGKPTRQSPELTSEITRIVFNPKWNVPHMIAKNDIVPKMIENSNYLNENSIRIFNSQEDDAYEISPGDINWHDARENGFPYHFRQEPGIKNALGLVKFEFQNTHDVYLHDTPHKELFAKDVRDFSSGCIRLEKPFALVAYLTKDDDRIDTVRIRHILLTRHTTYFRVAEPLPIAIAYLTSWVDDTGVVHFANDVYNRDFGTPPDQQQSNNGEGDGDDNGQAN
jgi:murein L,D-transpeptidase YcbB/YkuD